MSNKHYIIPIFVPHEGCPHDCVFCNQNSITGSKNKINALYVRNTVENYLSTINMNKSEGAVIEISFFGGTFTGIDIELQRELLSAAYEYKKNKIINYIRLSTRPDYINREILDNLKEFEVDIIELGVQSFDKDVLKSSRRGHDSKTVEKACYLIKEYGFILGIQLMLGLPGDTFEKDMYSAEKTVELKPDIARIYPALVIKNTAMEVMYRKGEYTPYTLEECIEIGKRVYAMLVTNNIKVIRVGLQPTEEINDKCEVVAGPFHSSIRELIEGKLLNDMICSILRNEELGSVEIAINNKDISKLYAFKKKFFNETKKFLQGIKIDVKQDQELSRGTINIVRDNEAINYSLYEYMIRMNNM